MIVVTVEVWPFGDEGHKRHIGTAVIANDATGTAKHADYNVWVGKPTITDPHKIIKHKRYQLHTGRVIGFPRIDSDAWELVALALDSATIDPHDLPDQRMGLPPALRMDPNLYRRIRDTIKEVPSPAPHSLVCPCQRKYGAM